MRLNPQRDQFEVFIDGQSVDVLSDRVAAIRRGREEAARDPDAIVTVVAGVNCNGGVVFLHDPDYTGREAGLVDFLNCRRPERN